MTTTRETADHAELVAMKPDDIIAILRADRLPECSFDNGMTWVTDDVIVAETFARTADAIENLLSEIAALRVEGRDVAKEALEYRRQRDEAVELLRDHDDVTRAWDIEPEPGSVSARARAFLANQGATCMTPDHSALIGGPCAATDQADLRDRIMNPNVAKSEAEWWASREIERLESILRDLTEWRDIATAPKDGTWIQAWREPAGPNGGAWEPLVYVRWDDDDKEWVWPDSTYEVFTERGQERANRMIADYENFADNSFTRWLPLPSAPNQAKEAGE